MQLITSLRKPGQVEPDVKTRALASMVTYYVTGKPTTTTINPSMTLHGLTRSKELIETLHRVGACLSYASVLLLRDAWAVHDLQRCTACPHEIAEDRPGVVIVDNDDFRNDTLTGGNTSHRTNVMYVQLASLEYRGPLCDERVKDAKVLSTTLKEMTTELQAHGRYVTHKRGELPNFRKTQKSKLLQKLIQQPQEITSYTAVVDMGMIWRLATPTVKDRDKGDGSPYTWGDYANKMASMILARHKDANSIVCVNDPYGQTESIKDDERELRIQGHGHIPNVFMKAGDAFPSAREFKTIMCSSGNKKRLQSMIKAQLTDIAQSIKQEVLYSVGEECTSLSSGTSLNELSFSQCEADTIMLSIYVTLRSQGIDDPFVIDAADTDVYVQAAAISHEIPGILYIRKKNELLLCKSMCSDQNVAKCLIPFHVMTGCDSNSCF